MTKDLTARRDQNPLLDLSWKPDALVVSVRTLAEVVENDAVKASDWYMAKRKLPSFGARWSRVLAIVFVTIGGLAPLIESTFGKSDDVAVTGTGIGYLFLALAAASVALDRYAGFSSSWMRRVTTAQSIKRLLVEFQVQWPPLLAEVEAKDNVTAADVKPLFERVAKLAADVEDLVKEETRLWKVEFESAFAQLEKATQAGKAEAQEQKEAPKAMEPAAGPQGAAPIVPAKGPLQQPAVPPVQAASDKPLPAETGDALLTTKPAGDPAPEPVVTTDEENAEIPATKTD